MRSRISVFFQAMLLATTFIFNCCEKEEKSNTVINTDGKTGTVTDFEGNVYKIVKIGEQWWMAENLKTTKYKDGEAILNVDDDAALTDRYAPTYCWYDNDEATNKNKYGALYNWYTVNTGKLAPEGWHVSTDEEWDTLTSYLIANGYNYDGSTTGNKIAKSMALTTGWASYTEPGTVGNADYPEKRNATGFSALPGGGRGLTTGLFTGVGAYGFWWGSTEVSDAYAWGRNMFYTSAIVGRHAEDKRLNISIRCVRDY